MGFSMTPITLPGTSIRPPSSRPGRKNISKGKKQKVSKKPRPKKPIRKLPR